MFVWVSRTSGIELQGIAALCLSVGPIMLREPYKVLRRHYRALGSLMALPDSQSTLSGS